MEKFFCFCLKIASLAFRTSAACLVCGLGQSVFLELLEFALFDALLIFDLDVFAPLSRQYNRYPTLGGGSLRYMAGVAQTLLVFTLDIKSVIACLLQVRPFCPKDLKIGKADVLPRGRSYLVQ